MKRLAMAAATVLVVLVASTLLQWLVGRRAKRRAEDDFALKHLPVDVIGRTRWLLPVGAALLLAPRWLVVPPIVLSLCTGVGIVALGVQAGLYVVRAVDFFLEREANERRAQSQAMSSFGVAKFMGHVTAWSIVVVLVLANLGVNVTGLVASLGVGGIAVALAAQNVLSDLFASLSIVLDRPFDVGDFIVLGDEVGTVERIGLKTTRVASLGGEQLVISNGDLLSSRIRNYQRMQERRIVFRFGVEYGTSSAKLREISKIAARVVDDVENARLDRAHFTEFGDSSLDFEVVYYVTKPDFLTYRDVQQEINLRLVEALEALGVSFAFPTRTLHLASAPTAPLEVVADLANHENGSAQARASARRA